MKYTEQAVETLDDAGGVIANKNIEIEQLRQRVQELEKERDKAAQYWQIAEGRCDALIKKRDDLLAALENCRLLAARHRKEEWATHILRFCVESGVIGSPIRDTDIASVKEKA